MTSQAHWSALLSRVYRWIWIGRIHRGRPLFPPGSLILAAHYNGAIDGFVYGSQLPPFLGVVSSQWHGSLIGRWLIPGIALVRAKDRGSNNSNAGSFRRMLAALAQGDCLLYFPEGTSQLGLDRLPVRRGTLLLLQQLQSKAPETPIFFAAANYHQPTLWRSSVVLGWIGPITLPRSGGIDESWVSQYLLKAQSMAHAVDATSNPGRLHRRPNVLGIALAFPYVPVWIATSFLARRIADEDNVIALWKFLLGVPATLIATTLYIAGAFQLGVPAWLPIASLICGAVLWRS